MQVNLPGPATSLAIAGSARNGCALVPSDGTYCWASNQAPAPLAQAPEFKAIFGGTGSFCGLTHDGEAHCWGRNDTAELGNGTRADAVSRTLYCGVWRSMAAVELPGSPAVSSTGLGQASTCAILAAGGAMCWGDNGDGILGTGSMDGESTPVKVTGDHDFEKISVGWNHACALTSGGELYCWGRDNQGTLGVGGDHPDLVPCTPVRACSPTPLRVEIPADLPAA